MGTLVCRDETIVSEIMDLEVVVCQDETAFGGKNVIVSESMQDSQQRKEFGGEKGKI